ATVVTTELLEERYHLVKFVDVGDDNAQCRHQLVALPRHLDREHRAHLGVAQEQVRVKVQRDIIAGLRDLRPAPPQGGGIHQVADDPDSTMSGSDDPDSTIAGSVAITAAPALAMMSSGTPASFVAPARWPTTRANSSLVIPRPSWASSRGRPS